MFVFILVSMINTDFESVSYTMLYVGGNNDRERTPGGRKTIYSEL